MRPSVDAACAALLALQFGCAAVPPEQGKVGPGAYQAVDASGEVDVIVSLRGTESPELESDHFTVTRRYAHIPALAGRATRRGLQSLESHPEVLKVDREGVRYASSSESVPLIRGDETRSAGLTGRGSIVAVIDTGVDSSHRDLEGAVIEEACFCGGCCSGGASTGSGRGSARDDNGHGTNVSGIIASAGRVSPVGVAPDAKIVGLRVLGPRGGSDSDILAALDYVLARPQIRVVNMSLGGGRFSTVCDTTDASNQAFASALANLRVRGTLTAVASGNEGFPDSVASPACINAALAIGAVYDDNVGGIRWSTCPDATTAADQVTCFSNSSPLVELLAPGALVTSAGLGGSTLTAGGTSQATPHVAGAAAVLLQVRPSLTVSEMIDIFKRTGRAVTDRKNGLTLPRINLRAAADAAR